MKKISQKIIVTGLMAMLLAACTASERTYPSFSINRGPSAQMMYAAMPQEQFPIPAVKLDGIEDKYLRQIVNYRSVEKPGTIIVDTREKLLYLILENGKAMRYGIGVGRQGYSWAGRARVGAKRSWPKWFPPAEMIAREPKLAKFKNGQEPGIDNPLGARALYIYEGDRDTLYRLHGTNEHRSIGKSMSSGCIRLLNQDIIDLYGRVPMGAPIVVLPDPDTIIASANGVS